MKEGFFFHPGWDPSRLNAWLALQAETPMWENHTTHQLKDGKSSLDGAGRDAFPTQQLRNNAASFWLETASLAVLSFLRRQSSSSSSQKKKKVLFLIFPTARTAYTAH